VTDLTFLSKPEHRHGPLSKFTDDDKILKGFLWKPKERPVSKESIIPSLDKNYHPKPKVKPLIPKKAGGIKAAKDTSLAKPFNIKLQDTKSAKDSSILKPENTPSPVIKTGKDTTVKKTTRDSSTLKPVGKAEPGVKNESPR
ncbi:MAG: hypothetical protein ABI203_04100, partial [Mucilaginibacter sp.]